MTVLASTSHNIPQRPIHWAASIASVTLSTCGGAVIGGLPGAAVGLCTSIADEVLIHQKIQNKHLISSATFWSTSIVYPFTTALSSLVPVFTSPLASTVSLVVGCTIAYFTDDFLSFETKLNLPLDSFVTLNRFFDENQILSKKEAKKIGQTLLKNPLDGMKLIYSDMKELYHNQFLMGTLKVLGIELFEVTMNTAVLVFLSNYTKNLFVSTWATQYKATLEKIKIPLGKPITFAFLHKALAQCSGIFYEGLKIIGVLFARFGLEFASATAHQRVHISMREQIYTRSIDLLIKDQNWQKLLASPDGQEVLRALINDISTLFEGGSSKLEKIYSEAYSALLSFSQLKKFSPTALFPYFVSVIPLQKGLVELAKEAKSVADDYMRNGQEYWNIISDFTWNIEHVKLRDADDFFKAKYREIKSKAADIERRKDIVHRLNRNISNIFTYCSTFIDMVYLGFQILLGNLKISDLALFKDSISKTTDYLVTNLKFLINASDLLAAKERIDKFFTIIDHDELLQASRLSSDQNTIRFKDYMLTLDGKELISIGDFSFEKGKRYALTGQSGCGKSSTLIDLKQGVYGSLKSSGQISYFSNEEGKTSIMFINQALYLPYRSPLLEAIYFPKIIDDLSKAEQLELRERILGLFEELAMDTFVEEEESVGLSNKLDTNQYKLSGGQTKKIGLIQAIFAQPDILILDEIFTGLDPHSLTLCQRAIEKYLPNTTILSVDHHAHDNNSQGFYHSEVNFDGGTLSHHEMPASLQTPMLAS